MKNSKTPLVISAVFFVFSLTGAYLAYNFAALGLYHYGAFIIGPIIAYDGISNYKKNGHLNLVNFIQMVGGTFMATEHLYLVQVFWSGGIGF